MNTLETAKQRLLYTQKSNKAEAVALVDLTILRAQRLIEELKGRRDRMTNEDRMVSTMDVLGWAQNDVQNFIRNIDPDRWMRVAATLAADQTAADLIAGIESEG